jgi:ATP-dependent Clp protease ATP-binding subunit ClpC
MAVAVANQQTHRLGGNVIGDVELLLGIARLPACNGASVLRQLGVNLKRLRSTLERQVRPLATIPAPAKLPQSPQFKLAVEAAIESSAAAGHEWVGTEHMLLGLLKHPGTSSSQVLATFGVAANQVAAAVLTPAAARRDGGEA